MKSFLLLLFFCSAGLLFGQNEWTNAADMIGDSKERHHPVTFSLEGYGYVVTGVDINNFTRQDFFRYDPVEDSWEQLPDFPGQARGFSYGDTANGKAYLGFGLSSINTVLNDLWEYDPTTATWTMLAPCPCAGRLHPTFVAEGDYIVVGFGNNSSGNINDFWQYQISKNEWVKIPDIPGNNRHHPFYFGIDGVVYTGLGHGSTIEIWDGKQTPVYRNWYSWEPGVSTEWTVLNDFPGEPRVAGQQFAYDGKGYVISGQGYDHQNFVTGQFWEYTPETDSWVRLPNHPGTARWAPGSFVLNDRFYLYGGRAHKNGDKEDYDLRGDMLTLPLKTSSVELGEELSGMISPNPASSTININMGTQLQSFRIIDINGAGVLYSREGQSAGIDISSLANGTYTIFAKDALGKISYGRFVKN